MQMHTHLVYQLFPPLCLKQVLMQAVYGHLHQQLDHAQEPRPIPQLHAIPDQRTGVCMGVSVWIL